MICPHCGQVNPENATHCAYCGGVITTERQVQNPAEQAVGKPENLLGGIIGAVIGAAIGAAVIILLGQIGYVASIAGVVLAFCSLKGYEKLGGKLSTLGIVICIVLMLITPYLAHRAGLAITFSTASEGYYTFAESFEMIPEIMEQAVAMGELAEGDYIKEVLMLYGFTALGAVGTVATEIKKKKQREKVDQ